MDDRDIVRHITELVDEEHQLRAHTKSGVGVDESASERIQAIEVQLDQCWDLLRRRQARQEFGENPDSEHDRPASVVENYRQ